MEKYGTLRYLTVIINFIAWLNLISGIILTIFSIGYNLGASFIIIGLLGGLIGFILLLSFGKLIQLVLDIREKQIEKEKNKKPMEIQEETSLEQIEVEENKNPIRFKGEKSLQQIEITEISIIELRGLIIRQKKSYIGNKKKTEIISILNKLVTSKESAKILIEKYKNKFGINIIDELKDLSKNYAIIKEYLLPFIEFKIVKGEYPHELIEY